MRVLFLGSITLEKGLAALLEAARMVEAEPIEFWMVGDPHPGFLEFSEFFLLFAGSER